MALELTSVFENLNNIKRNLFYVEGVTLRFMNRNALLLDLEDGWYLRKYSTSSIGDKSISSSVGTEEFFECSVAIEDENIDLEAIIKLSSNVEIGNYKYKISAYSKPNKNLATQKWNLRLTSFGTK